MSTAENKAVFLSYASQDAEAAKRICESLRAAGVEVWFDQNELVGGDAWDQKIRKQIKECALFVPMISAATQARAEGYFRREWKLAVERTNDMADHVAFLLPVVIDATSDAAAFVPEKFREVQWTRLPSGETPVAFCERVKLLLGGDGERSLSNGPNEHGSSDETGSGETAVHQQPRQPPHRNRVNPALRMAVVIALVVLLGWLSWRVLQVVPAVQRETSGAARVTPRSEPRQLIAKAWELLNKPEMARAELDAAEALCNRAAALDATDADVWAAWSSVNTWYVFHNLDRSPSRQEAAREYAARALQLDPKSYEARLAQSLYRVRGVQDVKTDPEAQRLLRSLLQEKPDEPRALFTLGFLLSLNPSAFPDGVALLRRLAANPGFAAVAWDEIGWMTFFAGDVENAEDAATRSLSAQPYWNNLGLKITLAARVHGDMDMALAALEQMPASALQEDWGIGFACDVYQWRREPLRTLRVLEGVQRDWIHYFFRSVPKVFLVGEARLMAKQESAARREFQRALDLIEKQLSEDSNSVPLLSLKARALAYLGEREAAQKIYQLVKELGDAEDLRVIFEPADAAIAYVAESVERSDRAVQTQHYTPASLRLDPYFDPLRSEPKFQALLAQLSQRGGGPTAHR